MRTVYNHNQVTVLNKEFSKHRYISSLRMQELGKAIGMEPKKIKVWFQNRRMKEKKEKESKKNIMQECVVKSEISFEIDGIKQEADITDLAG